MTTEQANQLTAIYNSAVLHSGDKVLLWTNSNPTSSFAPQTISVDLSSYRYAIICISAATGSNIAFGTCGKTLYPVGFDSGTTGTGSISAYPAVSSTLTTARRILRVMSTGVTFGSGATPDTTAGNFNENNSYGIPMYIYGI